MRLMNPPSPRLRRGRQVGVYSRDPSRGIAFLSRWRDERLNSLPFVGAQLQVRRGHVLLQVRER
jgi:hypothetical protein